MPRLSLPVAPPVDRNQYGADFIVTKTRFGTNGFGNSSGGVRRFPGDIDIVAGQNIPIILMIADGQQLLLELYRRQVDGGSGLGLDLVMLCASGCRSHLFRPCEKLISGLICEDLNSELSGVRCGYSTEI